MGVGGYLILGPFSRDYGTTIHHSTTTSLNHTAELKVVASGVAKPGPRPGICLFVPKNLMGKYEFKSSLIEMNTWHFND